MVDYQKLRPDADDATGGWTNEAGGTPLYTSVDETSAADADYIRSAINPSADVCRVRLSNPSGGIAPPGKLRVRYRNGGSGAIDLIVRLKQGTSTIATRTFDDIPTTFTDALIALDTGEYSAITDFNDLFVELQASLATVEDTTFVLVQRDGQMIAQRDDNKITTRAVIDTTYYLAQRDGEFVIERDSDQITNQRP